MFVCICNGVTDSQIRQAAANGCREVSELTMRTGCGATCGSCMDMAKLVALLAHPECRQGLKDIYGVGNARADACR